MRDVSAEEVSRAAAENGITHIDHHACSICGYMTHYSVHDGNLYFHPGCNCGRWSDPEKQSWANASAWINMQSQPEIKEKLARSFGIDPEKLGAA